MSPNSFDDGNFYDIMHSDLFEKMSLRRRSLLLYEGSDLKSFNGITTRPWSYVEIVVSLGDGNDI